MTHSIVEGTKVKLSKQSEFYDINVGDPSNPIHTEGKVVKIGTAIPGVLHIRVNWDNGESNAYVPEDLVIVEDIVRRGKGNPTLKKSDIYTLGMMMYDKGLYDGALDTETLGTQLRLEMDRALQGLQDE